MRDNAVKHALARGETVIGTMITEVRTPAIGMLLARAGFDYFFIDMEHGTYDLAMTADIIKIARLSGIVPLVRVPDAEYHFIARILDAGAMGIMVPRVETREQVERITAATRFPPHGVRGASAGKGNTDYQAAPGLRAFTDHADANVLTILQIERRHAIEHIDELLSVPGVDVALIGPNDLALSLGADRIDDPMVDEAIAQVVAAARRHEIASGIHVRSLEVIRRWQAKGMRMLTFSSDVDFIVEGASAGVAALRESP